MLAAGLSGLAAAMSSGAWFLHRMAAGLPPVLWRNSLDPFRRVQKAAFEEALSSVPAPPADAVVVKVKMGDPVVLKQLEQGQRVDLVADVLVTEAGKRQHHHGHECPHGNPIGRNR